MCCLGCLDSQSLVLLTHRLQPFFLQQPLQLVLRQLRCQHGSPLPPPLSILRLLGLRMRAAHVTCHPKHWPFIQHSTCRPVRHACMSKHPSSRGSISSQHAGMPDSSAHLQQRHCRVVATSAAAMALWRLLSMLASAALAEAISLCFRAVFSSICWSLYKKCSVRQSQTPTLNLPL